MKIAVSVDSSCDIPEGLKKELNIFTIPIPVTLGDKIYYSGVDITSQMIYDYVDSTGILPRTSAINAAEYEEYFAGIIKQGYDAIIHISIGSGFTNCKNNALKAAEQFKNVKIIDSKNLTMGEGFLALAAAEQIKEGKELSEIIATVNGMIDKMRVGFVLCDVTYLHKGGRCSGLAMFMANMLKLKPRISVVDGKMGSGKKYRGKFGDALGEFIDDFLKENKPVKNQVSLCYTTCEEEILVKLRKQLLDYGFKKIIESIASTTITCHCGKNTLGIIFENQD